MPPNRLAALHYWREIVVPVTYQICEWRIPANLSGSVFVIARRVENGIRCQVPIV